MNHRLVSASLASLGFLLVFADTLRAEDWPQWRGPNRDDISLETGLLKSWPEGGPKRVWLHDEAGLGYAGFSVVGDTLYTMGARGGTEYVIAIDTQSGKQRWATPVGGLYENRWGDGPRSTPTVDGRGLYALSARGNLACLRASDGKKVWSVRMQELGGETPGWGYTESVLVDGNLVLCTPGGNQGAMAALHKRTGKRVWQSRGFTDPAQYSSIIAIENAGRRQYVQLTQKHVVGIDARTGKQLWESEWPGRIAVIPTPIHSDGKVYVTSGYGIGCKLLSLDDKHQVEEVYFNKVMKNHHGGVILLDGHLYGYSDNAGWTCQDFETGERVWNDRQHLGKGCISYADDRFYCLDETTGEVALIEPSTEGWKEHGRFTLSPQTQQRKPDGRIWVHPVIANGKLYLRDQELIYCYDIRADE